MGPCSEQTTKPISLMLVDDNPTFLRILRHFLEEANVQGLSVLASAHSVKEALEAASTVRPSLMVVDLLMPDSLNLELIRSLRRILPEAGIIALTIFGAEVYGQAAFAAGADECLTRAELEQTLLPALLRVARARAAGLPPGRGGAEGGTGRAGGPPALGAAAGGA